jgi:hypothetical protein
MTLFQQCHLIVHGLRGASVPVYACSRTACAAVPPASKIQVWGPDRTENFQASHFLLDACRPIGGFVRPSEHPRSSGWKKECAFSLDGTRVDIVMAYD